MNNKMNILKAIGIITVVIGHTWSNIFAWFLRILSTWLYLCLFQATFLNIQI